ncbi:MAG: hypothetical protein IKD07_01990, partial [Clostridia bacterium]|nr:hypothetical protein [Clostridia bacterium]
CPFSLPKRKYCYPCFFSNVIDFLRNRFYNINIYNLYYRQKAGDHPQEIARRTQSDGGSRSTQFPRHKKRRKERIIP